MSPPPGFAVAEPGLLGYTFGSLYRNAPASKTSSLQEPEHACRGEHQRAPECRPLAARSPPNHKEVTTAAPGSFASGVRPRVHQNACDRAIDRRAPNAARPRPERIKM